MFVKENQKVLKWQKLDIFNIDLPSGARFIRFGRKIRNVLYEGPLVSTGGSAGPAPVLATAVLGTTGLGALAGLVVGAAATARAGGGGGYAEITHFLLKGLNNQLDYIWVFFSKLKMVFLSKKLQPIHPIF